MKYFCIVTMSIYFILIASKMPISVVFHDYPLRYDPGEEKFGINENLSVVDAPNKYIAYFIAVMISMVVYIPPIACIFYIALN